MDDKWTLFKNYMHNELGIGKDDIRSWIQEAIDKQAKQMVDKTFVDFSVEDIVTRIVKKEVNNPAFWGNGFSMDVKEMVSKELSKKIMLNVKE